jgi:hypothetical protein
VTSKHTQEGAEKGREVSSVGTFVRFRPPSADHEYRWIPRGSAGRGASGACVSGGVGDGYDRRGQ